MDYSKFSINSLFEGKKIQNNKLDINTLFHREKKQKDSSVLLVGIKRNKEQLKQFYEQVFNSCWALITKANDSGMTNIMFNIPVYCNHKNYSYTDCISHICIELETQKIHAIVISPTSIFINWVDLEYRMEHE